MKKEYWDNGKLKSEVPHNGLGTSWYESGEKKKEVHFKNGKLVGLAKGWHKNGKKMSEFHSEGVNIDISLLSNLIS